MNIIHHLLGYDDDFRSFEEGSDLYSAEGIDAYSDNDEISIEEDAFMRGYLNA